MEDIAKKAKTAKILGIIGIVLAFVGFLIPFGGIGGLVCDIIAIVMGVKYRNLARQAGMAEAARDANTGMVLGIIGVAIFVLVLVLVIAFAAAIFGALAQAGLLLH